MARETKGSIEFLINDFNDTSEKLESTDKKVQFSIQIFGLIVSALITLLVAFFVSGGAKQTVEFIFVIFSISVSIIMGEFIYHYNLKGHYTHSLYVNRMNIIRRAVYSSSETNVFENELAAFTMDVKATSKGMNFTMIRLLSALTCIFSGLLAYVIASMLEVEIIIGIIIGAFLVASILIINYILYKKTMDKAAEQINKMWGIINESKTAKIKSQK